VVGCQEEDGGEDDMSWQDILRKGDAWEMEQMYGMSSADIVDMFAEEGLDREEPDWEELHSVGDWIYNKVIKWNNPQLQKLAKEYVGIWIDLDTGEEIEELDGAKEDTIRRQIIDLLRERLPIELKEAIERKEDPLTDEEINYFLGSYFENENLYHLTSDIIKPMIPREIWYKL
jgi:hypothetical protein